MALRSERPKKEKKDTQTEYTCASPQCLLSVQWPHSGSLNQRKRMEPEGDPNIWQENKAGKQLGFAGSSGHFAASEVVMLLYSPTASCRHPKNPQYRPRSLHTAKLTREIILQPLLSQLQPKYGPKRLCWKKSMGQEHDTEVISHALLFCVEYLCQAIE